MTMIYLSWAWYTIKRFVQRMRDPGPYYTVLDVIWHEEKGGEGS